MILPQIHQLFSIVLHVDIHYIQQVAALASDKKIMKMTGKILPTAERQYM
jgi:hypothetical protein